MSGVFVWLKFHAREQGETEWQLVDEPGVTDPEDAAESYVRNVAWPEDERCSDTPEFDVEVKDEKGVVTRWTVTVEMVPSFAAYPKKDGEP